MKEKKHLKNKKITILKANYNPNELGEQAETWAPIPGGENIWAYYRHASANEIYGAATTNYRVEVIFQIAWRDDINSYMQIRYKGKDYRITRIDDFEGNKTDLKIYAYIINP